MKRYKVLVDIREKENPYSGEIETKEIEVEAENEYNASKLALEKANIPDTKIWWELVMREL